jgi:hypothetical protein
MFQRLHCQSLSGKASRGVRYIEQIDLSAHETLYHKDHKWLTWAAACLIWQDGTTSEGVLSTDLIPVEHVDEHDVWPHTFIVSVDEDDSADTGAVT